MNGKTACTSLSPQDQGHCTINQLSDPYYNPTPQIGDHDPHNWEQYIYTELACLFVEQGCLVLTAMEPAEIQGLTKMADETNQHRLTSLLSPFAASSEKLIDSGLVTTAAKLKYGDAMAQSRTIYPKETFLHSNVGKGVATCTNGGVGPCGWDNTPVNTLTGNHSSTCDIFYMQIPLQRGRTYALAITAEQTAIGTHGQTSRRLLQTVFNANNEPVEGITISGFSIVPALSVIDGSSVDNNRDDWKNTNPKIKYWLYPSRDNMDARDHLNDKWWWHKHTDVRWNYYGWSVLAAFLAILWTKLVLFLIFWWSDPDDHSLLTSSRLSTYKLPEPVVILYEVFGRPNVELLREIYLTRSRIATAEDAKLEMEHKDNLMAIDLSYIGNGGIEEKEEVEDRKVIVRKKHNENMKVKGMAGFTTMSKGNCHLFGMTIFVAISLHLDMAVGVQGVFFMLDALVQAVGGFYAYTGHDMAKTSTHLLSMLLCVLLAPFCSLYINWFVWTFIITFLLLTSLCYKRQPGHDNQAPIKAKERLSTNPKHRYAMLAQAAGGAPMENPGVLARIFGTKARAHPSNKECSDFSIP